MALTFKQPFLIWEMAIGRFLDLFQILQEAISSELWPVVSMKVLVSPVIRVGVKMPESS